MSGVGCGVALVGPTASGKTAVAQAAAVRHGRTEILSVDAMSVYREMDAATAKPTVAERAVVPHHLVDVADPDEEYTLSRYQRDARAALEGVAERRSRPLLVGGTGLYLRSVVDDLAIPGRFPAVRVELEAALEDPDGAVVLHERLRRLDPVAAGRIDPRNHRRLVRALEVTLGAGRPFSSFGPGLEAYPPSGWTLLGLSVDPTALDRRIADRMAGFVAAGLVEEVRALAARPAGLSRTARQALGYKEVLHHIEDGAPLASCLDAAITRTRRFARRQWAWFRRDPRIRWIEPGEDPVAQVLDALGPR